jgi:uncharacterized membrane protein AbrB (regulator of aidB expression)
MSQNKGVRTITGLVARLVLAIFGCTFVFTGWWLGLSFRAEDPSQSPLNPVGMVVFSIVLLVSGAVSAWALWMIFRERQRATEKSKNEDSH